VATAVVGFPSSVFMRPLQLSLLTESLEVELAGPRRQAALAAVTGARTTAAIGAGRAHGVGKAHPSEQSSGGELSSEVSRSYRQSTALEMESR
jgi:hypothetical protein